MERSAEDGLSFLTHQIMKRLATHLATPKPCTCMYSLLLNFAIWFFQGGSYAISYCMYNHSFHLIVVLIVLMVVGGMIQPLQYFAEVMVGGLLFYDLVGKNLLRSRSSVQSLSLINLKRRPRTLALTSRKHSSLSQKRTHTLPFI